MLEKCELCPHRCRVNRLKGQVGRCNATDKVKIALYSLHKFEEPCISGRNGSGTIFFSNCNLRCKFCQNYEISWQGLGKEISINELSEIFLKQQENGANNINLVTPTMYVYQIIEAIDIAKNKGLNLPIIYNTNGYDSIETLQLLERYIDIYLPDFKYYNNDIAKKYSSIDNYFEIATKAIKEMYKQVGNPIFNDNGIITKGLIIRHLILPNYMQNTKHILKWIKDNIGDNAYISIMSQYFPTYLAKNDSIIGRKVNRKEYKIIEQYLYSLDFKNGYIQELGDNEEYYVPDFNSRFKLFD